ncbi:MAG TPA: alpha-hydroxy acid oxidase [Steroidobacteraceae bacterium]|nr:alpha-hydroxy acid oxidase [Steroidobacteraceae bacterium]
MVSNHGGRQLDGARAAMDALPEVVTAVNGKADVYVEGGVRRASDILAAFALGANGVGIGRPVLWALLAGGEAGVAHYLQLLTDELANSMALAGCRDVADIGRDLLA